MGDTPSASGEDISKASDPELFFSDGVSNYLNTKCCYFIRTSSTPIDTTASNDSSLLYGEISDSPLQTIESLLSGSYGELFVQVRRIEYRLRSFLSSLLTLPPPLPPPLPPCSPPNGARLMTSKSLTLLERWSTSRES